MHINKEELRIFDYFMTLKKKGQMATMEQIKQNFKGEISREKVEETVKHLVDKRGVSTETSYGLREMTKEEFEELLIKENKEN